MLRALAAALTLLACATPARADGGCRLVEVRYLPSPRLQIAVWIEDAQGHYVDTAYVTRATGALGLANRPGNALFKSALRWPYGRREMVLPVWAHRRDHHYGLVTMGGALGRDRDDDSIGYHEPVSSTEPFYCPPSVQPLDAMSCASTFVGSKGVYAPDQFSLYPPRGDLTNFQATDSNDARAFAGANDLAALSGATPLGAVVINPPVRWVAPKTLANGRYVMRIEASLEGDFNDSHHHPSFPDVNTELRSFGREPFGQPSVVYSVPFTLHDTDESVTISDGWDGYGAWDGATGALTPPDGTISDAPGSGAGRLAHVTDGAGTWRVRVSTGGCAGCVAPPPSGALTAKAADTTLALSFTAPPSSSALDAARSYDIRYRPGSLDESSFSEGIPADQPPPPGAPGSPQQVTLTGLKPDTTYEVGVRALNACGDPSPARFVSATTSRARYVVLNGCFIATAAYGSPMQPDVALLRRFRDRVLAGSTLGRLATAIYYAESPPLARAIATDPRLRALARRALAPAVALARAFKLTEDAGR